MRARIVLCIAFALATASFATSAATASPTTAAIDALCAGRSDRALSLVALRVARILGDPTTTSSAWTFLDGEMVERIAHDPNIYSEVAEVWNERGSVAIVNLESKSLEFREDATYCFRLDGSLARVATTSSGTYNIDDEMRYFSASGALVGKSSRLALLHPSPGASVSPDVKPSKPTIFLTAQSLPFYSLIDVP